jgi:Tfp pilus assembly protein PilO
MNHSLGMIIESLVAVLLVLTIGYCMVLNSRLKRLKADEQSLKAVIAELITATEIAERAIGGLKVAVRDVNENLGNQLATANEMSDQLKRQLTEGDNVVRRLSRIASAARPGSAVASAAASDTVETVETVLAPTVEPTPVAAPVFEPRVSGARAVAAAAQAFSERRRAGGLAA